MLDSMYDMTLDIVEFFLLNKAQDSFIFTLLWQSLLYQSLDQMICCASLTYRSTYLDRKRHQSLVHV